MQIHSWAYCIFELLYSREQINKFIQTAWDQIWLKFNAVFRTELRDLIYIYFYKL